MRTLHWTDYRNKTLGCWMGKNAGGTLGGPDEGKLGPLTLDWYPLIQAGGIPNDDLEIQLVWLHALETRGIRLTAEELGSEWLDHYLPNWDEYGFGKTNLRKGLPPPLSGTFNNWFQSSMGCPIRSEIWACVAPGLPLEAARMARVDAMVDHGAESVYAEMFFAVIESVAFLESERDRLVEYGLAAIPDDCRTSRAVRAMRESFRRSGDWKTAREAILKEVGNDSNFTDAPQNIAFTILGWYSSPDDFGKAICDAVNCGYDTDCTGATLGSILGIAWGADRLPEKWMAPLGRELAIDAARTRIFDAPKTVDELTDRTAAQAIGFFAGRGLWFGPGRSIELELPSPEALREQIREAGLWDLASNTAERRSHHAKARIEYLDGPVLVPGNSSRVRLELTNLTERAWEGVLRAASFDADLVVERGGDSFVIGVGESKSFDLRVRLDQGPSLAGHFELGIAVVEGGLAPWTFPVSFVRPGFWKMERISTPFPSGEVAEPSVVEGAPLRVDGNQLPFPEPGTYRGVTRVWNPSRQAREIRICAPSLGRMKLWLNGRQVMDNPGAERLRPTFHGSTPGQYETSVLEPGWNRMAGIWEVRSPGDGSHLFFTSPGGTPGGDGFSDLVLLPEEKR